MRNKQFIGLLVGLLWLLASTAIEVQAQKYVVYSVVGKAYVQQGKSFTPLTTRKYLTPATRLKITAESAVTILDESKLKMYSLTKEGVNAVGSLLDLSGKRTKSLSKQYMGYLVKQLFASSSRKMSHPDTYMQVTGTSYRAVSKDSLLAARIADIAKAGTAAKGTVEQQLFSPGNLFASDYDISFDLVDVQTGRTVKGEVAPNTACYVRVKNNTDETLYVNVLNIDANGNKYLVLPMDADATCANLLVPASCTVGFKSEPFLTSDVASKDAFVLVASEEPVNFSILMNPIVEGNHENARMKVGLARRYTETR